MFAAFAAPWLPIDFHSHGVGKFDFTEIPEMSLDAVERSLRKEEAQSILTLYLPKKYAGSLVRLLHAYHEGQLQGRYTHVLGIALEGPVLSSHGGTPDTTLWSPTRAQWREIAELGRYGLRYVVISPDSQWQDAGTGEESIPGLPWIVNTLLDGGVRPALGHMRKAAPEECADRIHQIIEIVARRDDGPIVTDHLYNDMPLMFRHAWRTASSRQARAAELVELDLGSWTASNIQAKVGPVPGAILEGARRGLIKVCLNFDGEHVDLAISTRTVEVMGAEKFLLMTDRIQSRRLAGHRLRRRIDSSLLYQESGIVAGGSQSPHQQIQNLRICGVPESSIRQLAFENAANLLGIVSQCIVRPEESFVLERVAHAV